MLDAATLLEAWVFFSRVMRVFYKRRFVMIGPLETEVEVFQLGDAVPKLAAILCYFWS